MRPRVRMLRCLVGIPGIFLGSSLLAAPEVSGNASNQVVAVSKETPAPAEAPRDDAAARFVTACAGCHSLSGVKLNGPDLSHVPAWPVDQLNTAIKRMQEKVGLLKEDEVNGLSDLLRATNVRDRVKAEEGRIQAQFRAKMEPPNAAIGRALFFGSAPLKNGGLACAACHAAEGHGGNLGTNLAGIFVRMGGETALISAIEKASFPIMAPHYLRHPITTQEAVHLAKYLSTLDPGIPAVSSVAFVPIGAGNSLALLAGLTLYLRSQRAARGRDGRLARRRK